MASLFDALAAQANADVLATFGEQATAGGADTRPLYTPSGGAPYRVAGVFSDGFVDKTLFAEGGPAFASNNPVLGVLATAFTLPPKQGDQVEVPKTGLTYLINQVEADALGWLYLELNEVD